MAHTEHKKDSDHYYAIVEKLCREFLPLAINSDIRSDPHYPSLLREITMQIVTAELALMFDIVASPAGSVSLLTHYKKVDPFCSASLHLHLLACPFFRIHRSATDWRIEMVEGAKVLPVQQEILNETIAEAEAGAPIKSFPDISQPAKDFFLANIAPTLEELESQLRISEIITNERRAITECLECW